MQLKKCHNYKWFCLWIWRILSFQNTAFICCVSQQYCIFSVSTVIQILLTWQYRFFIFGEVSYLYMIYILISGWSIYLRNVCVQNDNSAKNENSFEGQSFKANFTNKQFHVWVTYCLCVIVPIKAPHLISILCIKVAIQKSVKIVWQTQYSYFSPDVVCHIHV